MPLIAPVTALAGTEGKIWFAADDRCPYPVFANAQGQGEFLCNDDAGWWPLQTKAPAICVERNGPVPVLPPL